MSELLDKSSLTFETSLEGFSGGVTVLSNAALNRVCAAAAAIESITTLLYQREVDLEDEGENCLRLQPRLVQGLIQAMAICGKSISADVLGDGLGVHIASQHPAASEIEERAYATLRNSVRRS